MAEELIKSLCKASSALNATTLVTIYIDSKQGL